MFNLKKAQQFMQENEIDAWLIYDFRGNNDVMWDVLGEKRSTTRRSFLLVPKNGEIRFIAHALDKEQLSIFNYPIAEYTSWEDLHRNIKTILKDFHKVAMEYSPNAELPTMAWVDGGTIDFIRSLGIDVVSSADVFQLAAATWSDKALRLHLKACKDVSEIQEAAFSHIRECIRAGKVLTEYDVQQFILREFQNRGMVTQHLPVVAVNSNSSNPHYEPSAQVYTHIQEGDWVLIDLWARHTEPGAVFADITWVGYIGNRVPAQHQKIFDVVKRARDLVVSHLQDGWKRNDISQGWQVDMVAREAIEKEGYGQYFAHRTGHSIGPGANVHALGVNLDNLETHDTRYILPGIGFSVEPGIYVPEFGVRLEINMFVHPENGPMVTTPVQEEIILI